MRIKKGGMKHRGASSYIKLAGTAALFFVIYFLLASPVMVMTISHQETGDIYWSQRVHARDVLEYEWIHSFELIPYTEEFVIEEEGSLRLMTIGLVVMENINEIFEAIKWIHTTTNLTRINLNGEEILKGTDLPHHEAFYLEVEERSRIWTLQN